MRELDQLPLPIVVCAAADAPIVFDADDCLGACALCGTPIRYRPDWPLGRSLVCLLCFIVWADPQEPSVC